MGYLCWIYKIGESGRPLRKAKEDVAGYENLVDYHTREARKAESNLERAKAKVDELQAKMDTLTHSPPPLCLIM